MPPACGNIFDGELIYTVKYDKRKVKLGINLVLNLALSLNYYQSLDDKPGKTRQYHRYRHAL